MKVRVWRLSQLVGNIYIAAPTGTYEQVAPTENSCRFPFKMAAVGHLFEVKNTALPMLPELYNVALLKTNLLFFLFFFSTEVSNFCLHLHFKQKKIVTRN